MYQNGKLIDVKYYTDTKPKAGNKIEVSFTAQLVSGNNIFKANAFSKGRLEGKSSPILVKLTLQNLPQLCIFWRQELINMKTVNTI
ncbi:MAG: hypothetical protein IPN18_18695 [Ignavibacteriales bacterium]|nr:hypothetical protein [Ignavibacteriales bacterium]